MIIISNNNSLSVGDNIVICNGDITVYIDIYDALEKDYENVLDLKNTIYEVEVKEDYAKILSTHSILDNIGFINDDFYIRHLIINNIHKYESIKQLVKIPVQIQLVLGFNKLSNLCNSADLTGDEVYHLIHQYDNIKSKFDDNELDDVIFKNCHKLSSLQIIVLLNSRKLFFKKYDKGSYYINFLDKLKKNIIKEHVAEWLIEFPFDLHYYISNNIIG